MHALRCSGRIGRMMATGALALVMAVAVAGAQTSTPVQGSGGGAAADEYAKRSDLGFQWSGDARLRLDTNLRSDRLAQPRFRTRVRVGAKGKFGQGAAWWGFRLETQANDPISGNMTLGGGDANAAAANFGLGLAYLGFAPFETVDLVVGKMPNPFTTSEAIFDGDLQPAGLAAMWDIHEGAKGDIFRNVDLTTGLFAIRELGAVANDPWMFGAQLGTDIGPVRTHVGMFHYSGLNAAGANRGAAAMGQAANQLRAPGLFPSDTMTVIHGQVAWKGAVAGFPLGLSTNLFGNVQEDAQNFGWELRADMPKLWKGKAHVIVRDVGQDATFSPWADSDLGEGTGFHSGIEVEYSIPVYDNVAFALSYFHHDRFQPLTAPGPRSTDRFFFDISGKF